MDSTNPKVSFIPKGSLVREEFFLERSRPRSVIGFIASAVFILTFSVYAGLYYYNDSLNQVVAEKTTAIKNAQKEFSDAPEVGEAKVFRARVDLARELLNAHTVVSPVFSFLLTNTLGNILYERFSFKSDPTTGPTLELSGEAPTYAALAYQADVLRKQKKELLGFSVRDVKLTNFGTITFNLVMVFNPNYVLYTKSLSETEVPAPQTQKLDPQFSPSINFDAAPTAPATTSDATSTLEVPVSISTTSTTSDVSTIDPSLDVTPAPVAPASDTLANGWSVSAPEPAVATPAVPEQQSFWSALWSKFKFW